jgi:hypothetical protein
MDQKPGDVAAPRGRLLIIPPFSAFESDSAVYFCLMNGPGLQNRYETYATAIAPAAAGVALGMLFGRDMERKTSNVIAFTLLSAAVMVAAPVVTDLVQRAAYRPGSRRGSRRRLQGIRNGAMPAHDADDFSMIEELPSGMV